MKKISLLLLLFVQVVSYGQSFDFISGVDIRNAQDHSKGFIVFDFPGMTADDIRTAVVSKIPTIYDYSTGRIQYGENNSVSLIASTNYTALFSVIVGWDSGSGRYIERGVGGDFIMNIFFKDGKIRYDAPLFQRFYKIEGTDKSRYQTYGSMITPIYELIDTEQRQKSTVKYFNDLVRALNLSIKEAGTKPSDW